jgi:endonuclease YncB( thermonuclease family)
MRGPIQYFQLLSIKQKAGLLISAFAAGLLLLPHALVYVASAIASYKFITHTSWRNITVISFSVAAILSSVSHFGEELPQATRSSHSEYKQEKHDLATQEDTNHVATSASTSREKVEAGESIKQEVESHEQLAAIGAADQANKSQDDLEHQSSTYLVTHVVDGDTIKVTIRGEDETVRLIGIDTPETVHPSKPVECFGTEASRQASELLEGTTIQLETDDSQGVRDKYNRLLAYVILPGGTNFNQYMIENGYAYEYTYDVPYKYQNEFKEAEASARLSGVGLWAPGVCEATEDDKIDEQKTDPVKSNEKWYVSSHHSSRFYYCEKSSVWKNLSPKYLRTYNTEAELLAEFPSHTLHESCK